ncbi:unnamed protein product [Mytilus coruscus]|uniref:PML C-terminal domain-containing protein n=1 Tax=Mytilus coruscus TaxID=42192 RepID=A0A6J8BRH2_MYTCO|nr:unnamed protein product [Mytilus coruscus]
MCWQKEDPGDHIIVRRDWLHFGPTHGKVMGFKVCSTLCRICDTASTPGKEPNPHDCPHSYTQESLHKHLLENDYIAHNAINDVLSLESIKKQVGSGATLICKYSFTTQSFIKQSNFSLETKKKITTFDNLKNGKFASSGIIHRMAESGLQFSHLMFAYERNRSEGVKSLLLEKRLDEKPRVTKNKSVIDKLLKYFTT